MSGDAPGAGPEHPIGGPGMPPRGEQAQMPDMEEMQKFFEAYQKYKSEAEGRDTSAEDATGYDFLKRQGLLPGQQEDTQAGGVGAGESGAGTSEGTGTDASRSTPQIPELDEEAKRDLSAAVSYKFPDLSQGKAQGLMSLELGLKGKNTLEDPEISALIDVLRTAGWREPDAEQFRRYLDDRYPSLDGSIKQKLVDSLPPLTDEDSTTDEQEKMGIDDRALQQARYDQIHEDAQKELDELPDDVKEKYRGRIENLMSKFTDYFSQEGAGRTFTRRLGKTLYFSLIIAFVLLVFEMSLINKAAGNKR